MHCTATWQEAEGGDCILSSKMYYACVNTDRLRKQILETSRLMTTFLICGAARPFYAPNYCLLEQCLPD